MKETWSHPIKNNPAIKMIKSEIDTITGVWSDILSGNLSGVSYRMGQNTAMGVEMLVVNAAGKVVGKVIVEFEGTLSKSTAANPSRNTIVSTESMKGKGGMVEGAGNVYKLSESNIKHISKHTPSEFANQVKYLSDKQLADKLGNTSFFNPNWSKAQVQSAIEQGYNSLRSQGLTGLQSYTVHGETIKIFIKADGTFDTAYGLHQLTSSFFGR